MQATPEMSSAESHPSSLAVTSYEPATVRDARYAQYKVIRRNGAVVGFEPEKIAIALTKAFLAVNGGQGAASARIRDLVAKLTQMVTDALLRREPSGGTFHIENIQDQVELALMRSEQYDVARSYVLYRNERMVERARISEDRKQTPQTLSVTENGRSRPLDLVALKALVDECCQGLAGAVDAPLIVSQTLKDLYDGVPIDEHVGLATGSIEFEEDSPADGLRRQPKVTPIQARATEVVFATVLAIKCIPGVRQGD